MNIPQVYFDTTVWISYFLEDDFLTYAEDQLERIETGTDVAIISPLILLEIIDVTRKNLLKNESFQGMDKTTTDSIKSRINARVQNILKRISILAADRKVLIVNSTTPMSQNHNDIYRLIRTNEGEILPKSKEICPQCKHQIEPVKYRYRILGHYDIQHALIAREFSASEIVTFDKAFPQLNQFAEFVGITITVPNL